MILKMKHTVLNTLVLCIPGRLVNVCVEKDKINHVIFYMYYLDIYFFII